MKRRAFLQKSGFTIVELLVAITVIGILASITIVGYNGVQRKASEDSVKNDLVNAAKIMETKVLENKSYPVILPDEAKTSPGSTLSLVFHEGLPKYSSLSAVQSGVLFQRLCNELIAEGYGRSTNMGGVVEQYITACNVYNYNQIQINGWNSHNFPVPITSTTLTNYAASIPAGDAWRPGQQAARKAFYTELNSRYLAVGGTYPITTFWDSWATSSNGGVMAQSLPTPIAPGPDGSTYCLQASHTKYTDMVMHIEQGGAVVAGVCP